MYRLLLILSTASLSAAVPQQSIFDAVVEGKASVVQTLIAGGADALPSTMASKSDC